MDETYHVDLMHDISRYEDNYLYMDDESLIGGDITKIDCFNNDDEFIINPFHEYILKLNRV